MLKRLRIRFSLKTFFVVFTLVCILTYVVMSRPMQQKRAVDRFAALAARATKGTSGGMPALGYRHQSSEHFNEADNNSWLREWFGNEYFGVVDTLQLDHTSTGDEDLQLLAALPDVSFLRLGGTKVTDQGMPELANCPELRVLILDGTSITDEGIEILNDLPNLGSLSLRGAYITDESIATLSRLKGLGRLDLRGTLITKTGFERLTVELPNCVIWTPDQRGYSLDMPGGSIRYYNSRSKSMWERADWKPEARQGKTRGKAPDP